MIIRELDSDLRVVVSERSASERLLERAVAHLQT